MRKITTALLAVLLLLVTCAAAACQSSCELTSSVISCNSNAMTSPDARGQAVSMEHCGASMHHSHVHHAEAGCCEYPACIQQLHLTEAEGQRTALALLHPETMQGIAGLAGPPAGSSGIHRVQGEHPPLRTRLLASLQTSLRI